MTNSAIPVGSAQAVAFEVIRRGPISRSALAADLGLSAASLTRISQPLLEAGIILESRSNRVLPKKQIGMGRPVLPLEINAGKAHFIGVNLTGSTALIVHTDMRAEVLEAREVTLAGLDPREVVKQVVDNIRLMSAADPEPAGIGVSLGGYVPDADIVSRAVFLDWTDVPLATLFQEATGITTMAANDLVALTEFEHWFGAGRESNSFAILTIGAGVGHGLIVNGQQVYSEETGLGRVGHTRFNVGGTRCDLGHQGCATALLTIPGITRAISAGLGRPITSVDLAELAASGNPVTRGVLADFSEAFAQLITMSCNFTKINQVVLGGEGIFLLDLPGVDVLERIPQHRHENALPIEIYRRSGSFLNWARGAATIAIQNYLARTI